MKYIRIKNKWTDDFEGSEIIREVYQIHSLTKGDDMNLWAFTFEGFPYCITEEDILKQADTIEELCDEFVLDHPLFANNRKTLYHSFEKAKNGIKKLSGDAHDLYSFEIYGAIWTDEGLIYVAKMNKEGDLELL